MTTIITFAVVRQCLVDQLKAFLLRRQLANTVRDIDLSQRRIKNSRAVITDEQEVIRKRQTEQARIRSELRELGIEP